MKKVFLSLAVLATIALASCDGKKANDSESANITVADETIEAQIDSVANEVTEEANDMKDVENALSEAEQHLNDAKDAANAIHDVSKQIEAAHDAAEEVLNNL